jgi:TubC N-terminal docking domain
MSALQIIREIEAAGAEIFIHNGGLRLVAAKGKVTPSMQAKVKENKAEIIDILSLTPLDKNANDIGIEDKYRPEDNEVPGNESEDLSVVGYNSARELRSPILVPDLCKDCPRLEIVNIMGTDVPGCLYLAPGEYTDGWRRLPQGIEECLAAIISAAMSTEGTANINRLPVHPPPSRPSTKKVKPSPLALEWLKDHKDVLRLAGWTAPELFRRDKSKGLAWVSLWDKESLEVSIKEDGVIVFQFQSATNQTITQTARPIKRKSLR